MNHLEFAAAESAALQPTAWERWITAAETLAGHHLDGDQDGQGFSYGYAFDAWKGDQTPEQYLASTPCAEHCGLSAPKDPARRSPRSYTHAV